MCVSGVLRPELVGGREREQTRARVLEQSQGEAIVYSRAGNCIDSGGARLQVRAFASVTEARTPSPPAATPRLASSTSLWPAPAPPEGTVDKIKSTHIPFELQRFVRIPSGSSVGWSSMVRQNLDAGESMLRFTHVQISSSYYSSLMPKCTPSLPGTARDI